jgi:hypothetical protein
MLPRVRTILLLVLPLLFSLGGDASAQVGRLLGTVAYATPLRPTPAAGVRVVAVDDYGQAWETRTDGNGIFVMILREGRYRVVAQGAPGYITYGEVWGYVRTGVDSVITPNPLFLVEARSSNNMTSPALSQMMTGRESTSTAQQKNFMFEMAVHYLGVGKLFGTIIYKDIKKPAGGVIVVAVEDGIGQRHEVQAVGNGYFEFVSLRPGWYEIVTKGVGEYAHYVPEQPVWGYVRANTNSSISPNPLFLVPSAPAFTYACSSCSSSR